MKICEISKADSAGGGASRVAEELTGLLNKNGVECDHFVSWSSKGYSTNRLALYGRLEKYIRKLHSLGKKIGLPELLPFELPIFFKKKRFLKYDLFHFHDLSSAISPLTLIFLAQFRPVVWTIHDCSPFTGGCLYPLGCEKFKTGCGKCPQIGEWPIDTHFDFTSLLRTIKGLVHKAGVITITPSNWMSEKAFSSSLLKTKPEVLANGIDTDIYRPFDKVSIRRELDLPQDRLTFLVSAGNLKDPRKGVALSLQTLQRLKSLKPFVILLGNPDPIINQYLEGIEYKTLGYIGEQEKLAKIYSAADLFLFCSLADNQPLAILESLASGTPIVGFMTGGIPEIVPHERCGYLVEQGDLDSLAEGIKRAVFAGKHKLWAIEGRARVCNNFSHPRFLSQHLELFRKLCRRKGLISSEEKSPSLEIR
jgi:glycosyltransferase involved in cell wall biosynthesis